MTVYDKIQKMSVEELAGFLIINSIEEDAEYDWDENAYTVIRHCYATPFGTYPHYWSYDDVKEDTIKILMSDE